MKLKDRAILFYEYDSKGGRDVDDGKVLVLVQVQILVQVLVLVRVVMLSRRT